VSARTVKVEMTIPQARALQYAAMYVTQVLMPGEGDGLDGAALLVTERAKAKLDAAIEAAEGN
jgi:hypothetical protein